MREIIGIFLLVLLTFSAFGLVSATASGSNITFEDRTYVNQGWGSTQYEPYISLTGNNHYIIVAGGPNYDYEIRINLYNKVWELVATGDMPNEGIQFSLYFQYRAHRGNTQIYNSIVTVTGEGVASILEGVGGYDSSSINEVRVTHYTILEDTETSNDPFRSSGVNSGPVYDIGPAPAPDVGSGSDYGVGSGPDVGYSSGPGADVGGGSDVGYGSGPGADVGGGSDVGYGSGPGADVGYGSGPGADVGYGSGPGADVGPGAESVPDAPVVEETDDDEYYEKYLQVRPRPPQNTDDSNDLASNDSETGAFEEKAAIAEMEETGLPFAIVLILVVIGLVAIKIRR